MAEDDKVALVRSLLSDTAAGEAVTFADGELEKYLALEGGSVKRAVATALLVIAGSEVLLSKVIKTTQGLSTNGAAVAAELRAQAKEWRAQADDDENRAIGEGLDDFISVPSAGEQYPYGRVEWVL